MLDIPSYILGKKSGGSSKSEEEYSTTEKRIGTWLDGKPLYQKVVTGTLPTTVQDGATASSQISISSLNCDNVIIHEQWFFSGSSNKNYQNLPQFDYDISQEIKKLVSTRCTRGNITIENSIVEYSDKPAYFVLRYTKTTD